MSKLSLLWQITKKIRFSAIYFLQFSFHLILTYCAKFELNSLRNNEITMTLLIQSFLAVTTKQRSEMTSYLNNGYDFMNYFAKFEKFLPHRIIMPRFMTIGSQMPELDGGRLFYLPYKLSSQYTPYKLGLNILGNLT